MTVTEVLVGILAGLAANECCDISPWLADRLVRRAARLRYGASERAVVRAEEWTAVIHERPGKLLKLVTAVGFFAAAGSYGAKIRACKSMRALPRGVVLTVVPVAIAGVVADVMFSAISLVVDGRIEPGDLFAFAFVYGSAVALEVLLILRVRVQYYDKLRGFGGGIAATLILLPSLLSGHPPALEGFAILAGSAVGLGIGMRVGYKRKRSWRLVWICPATALTAVVVARLLSWEVQPAAWYFFVFAFPLMFSIYVGLACGLVIWLVNKKFPPGAVTIGKL
jgi:hypothetical protein